MTVNNEVQIAPRENVVIEDYVTFSRGSQIVASQVVVTKNISEDYVVVAGVPAQIVKRYLKNEN